MYLEELRTKQEGTPPPLWCGALIKAEDLARDAGFVVVVKPDDHTRALRESECDFSREDARDAAHMPTAGRNNPRCKR